MIAFLPISPTETALCNICISISYEIPLIVWSDGECNTTSTASYSIPCGVSKVPNESALSNHILIKHSL